MRELVGIDRQHRHPVTGCGEVHAELVDEGRLADAGHAGDPDPVRAAGERQQLEHDLLGELAVDPVRGLHQGDRPGEDRRITGAHALDVLRDREGTSHRRQTTGPPAVGSDAGACTP